jgi:hypothetical protein
MFCPSIVSVVVGVIMMSASAGKFIGGAGVMAYVGGAVLGLFGLDASVGGLATLALVLGYTAASIELLGGFLFMIGCRKTSSYAAFALALVMVSALAVHLTGLSPISGTGFMWFVGVLGQIQLPLLLLAIFIKKSSGVFGCCKTLSCCETQKSPSSCSGEKCDK